MRHTLILRCACGVSETFAADRRYLLVAMIDASGWHTRPTSDGWGHVATCSDCHGETTTHAEAAEREMVA